MMLCGCIAKHSIKECRRQAKRLDTHIFEHRMDYLDNLCGIQDLYEHLERPLIATMRPRWEGGRSYDCDGARADQLIHAIDAGCSAVDVELDMGFLHMQRVIEHAHRRSAIVIVSKHHFEGTPSLADLRSEMWDAHNMGADIVKIVTQSRSELDNRTVLSLYEEAPSLKLIAFAMGETGSQTRADAISLGAPFMYVSGDAPTAPGQVGPKKLRKMLVGAQ